MPQLSHPSCPSSKEQDMQAYFLFPTQLDSEVGLAEGVWLAEGHPVAICGCWDIWIWVSCSQVILPPKLSLRVLEEDKAQVWTTPWASVYSCLVFEKFIYTLQPDCCRWCAPAVACTTLALNYMWRGAGTWISGTQALHGLSELGLDSTPQLTARASLKLNQFRLSFGTNYWF